MELQTNSRQIPKTKNLCANKKYYDILYAYLQCITEKTDKNIRIFSKKEINFTKLSSVFNLSRQTVSTKFKNLKDLGLVKEYDKDYYEIITLESDIASLIPYSTLKLIVDTLNENSISVYVYLLNCYYANEYKPFQFTLEQIKNQIGICSTTRSNDDVITNILFVLQKIGLIKYSMTAVKQDNDSFQNIKTIYQLDYLTNEIKMSC